MRLRPGQLVVPLVLMVALAVLASHTSRSSAAPVCHLAGSWSQSTPNVGSSTWVITADGRAQEHGLGNARGTATLGSNELTINWAISENFQGVYRWSLRADCSGTGTLTYTKVAPGDPRAGQSYPSTVQGPAPTEPSCPRAEPSSCPVRRPAITPAGQAAKLGVTTNYRAPPPGKVRAYRVPRANKRTLTGLIRFVDDQGNPVEGPDIVAVQAQAERAGTVCALLAARPDAPGVLEGMNPSHSDFASCVAVVARVLARSDQIRKRKLQTRAVAATSACPVRALGSRKAGSKLRVTCTPTANATRIRIRARSGTLRRVLGSHRINLVVGRTSIPGGPAKLRLRVRWTAR